MHAASLERIPDRDTAGGVGGLYGIAAAGALVNLVRDVHLHANEGTLWVDPYWVGFYLRSFGEGFRRRALLGTVCRVLFPAGVPVVALNVWGMLVLVACFALVFRALCRLVEERPSALGKCLLFALAGSCFTAVFYDAVGDMLHLALLLFCGAGVLASRLRLSPLVRLALLSAVVVVCFFVHEASLFFLVPAIPFVMKARPGLRDVAWPALLYVLLLGLSRHWSIEPIHAFASFHATLWHGGVLKVDPHGALNFRGELELVKWLYFRDHLHRVMFLLHCLRVVVAALAYVTALAVVMPRRLLPRTLQVFGCVLLFSAPLWIIAIDWGRFLTYTLFLTLVATGLWQQDADVTAVAAPEIAHRVARWLEAFAGVDLVPLAAIFVLLASGDYWETHIDSMTPGAAYSYCIVMGVALVVWLFRGRRPASVAP